MPSPSPSPSPSRDNLRGLTAMLVAVGALSVLDVCMKLLSPHYAPLQVASIRGFASLPIVAIWVALQGGVGQLRSTRYPLHLARGALSIGTLAAFTYALRRLPLAEAYTIFFVAPLLITALAVPILHERVDARRWIAIAVGFLGVIIVLRPTGAGTLTLAGLATLVAAAGYALSAITMRFLSRTDSTPSIVFWVILFVAIGAGVLAIPVWRPIQAAHWPVIVGVSLSGSLGQWALTEAFRWGEASFIAPFEYTALAWGLGFDWFLWKTLPPPITIIGAAVIIASGVYLVRRERTHLEAEHP